MHLLAIYGISVAVVLFIGLLGLGIMHGRNDDSIDYVDFFRIKVIALTWPLLVPWLLGVVLGITVLKPRATSGYRVFLGKGY